MYFFLKSEYPIIQIVNSLFTSSTKWIYTCTVYFSLQSALGKEYKLKNASGFWEHTLNAIAGKVQLNQLHLVMTLVGHVSPYIPLTTNSPTMWTGLSKFGGRNCTWTWKGVLPISRLRSLGRQKECAVRCQRKRAFVFLRATTMEIISMAFSD